MEQYARYSEALKHYKTPESSKPRNLAYFLENELYNYLPRGERELGGHISPWHLVESCFEAFRALDETVDQSTKIEFSLSFLRASGRIWNGFILVPSSKYTISHWYDQGHRIESRMAEVLVDTINCVEKCLFILGALDDEILISQLYTEMLKLKSTLNSASRLCAWCGENASLKCSACSLTRYCGSKCQKADWKYHKSHSFLIPWDKCNQSWDLAFPGVTCCLGLKRWGKNLAFSRKGRNQWPGKMKLLAKIWTPSEADLVPRSTSSKIPTKKAKRKFIKSLARLFWPVSRWKSRNRKKYTRPSRFQQW